MKKPPSRSLAVATKTIYAAFQALKEAGGSMALKDILVTVQQRVTLNAWEDEVYTKTGYRRWQSIFHFYSVDCVKAGFIVKNSGIWSLTQEGEKAMKAGAEGLMEAATRAYRNWAKENKRPVEEELEKGDEETLGSEVNLELIETQGLDSINEHIRKKNGYDFQFLVAALLRAMGYHTPFIAERGPDGGIDIVAYLDPLGFREPRVMVQVKHKPETSIPPGEVQSLIGALNKSSDVGLFVTSGQFSTQAKRVARGSGTHCELIDGNRFIQLWKEHYQKMPDADKALLPLHAVWFLGNTD